MQNIFNCSNLIQFFQRLLQSTVSFFDFQMNWSGPYPFEVEGDAYVIMPGLNSNQAKYGRQPKINIPFYQELILILIYIYKQ